MKKKALSFVFILISSLLLPACSGNGFHLRQDATLSDDSKKIVVQGISTESDLYSMFVEKIPDAGGEVVALSRATTMITLTDLKEDKKIVAYTGQRVAREYMLYLYVDYELTIANQKFKKNRIRLDKTLIYDASFVLGKAEEELRIQKSLREEAVRLILLQLRYHKE
jgi:outer membrane lipopolysaccharide assembly protein LptE/RlpB